MLVASIFSEHLACHLYIALCCCGFICVTDLWVIFPSVPRKHRTRCRRETSLSLHRQPVDNYSTRSARPVGSLITCRAFRLAINNLDINRGIIQVAVFTIPQVVCVSVSRIDRTRRFSYCCLRNTVFGLRNEAKSSEMTVTQYIQLRRIQALTELTKPPTAAIIPLCIVQYLSANTSVCNTTCGNE
jgi:hypothetical protein